MVEIVGAMAGNAPTVIDLGCGPGSLTKRVADGLPGARVVAVDADPVVLELGRQAVGDYAGRIRQLDADLRDPQLARHLSLDATADAAVSTTALHWLSPEELTGLFELF